MAGNPFLAGFGAAFAQALQRGQQNRDDQIRQQIQMLQLRQLLQQEQQNQAFGNLDLSQFGPSGGVSQPQPVGEPMSGAAGLGGPMPQQQMPQMPQIRGKRSPGGGMGFDIPALYDLAVKQGYQPGERAATAAALAMAESSGNPQAHNTSGEDSRGLMQINADAWGPLATFDPNQNMANSAKISKGGTDFSPWSAYKSGAYQQYMPAALAAARARGGSSSASPAQEDEGGGGDERLAYGGTDEPARPGSLADKQSRFDARVQIPHPELSAAYANALKNGFQGTVQDFQRQQQGSAPQLQGTGQPVSRQQLQGGAGPRSDAGLPPQDQVIGQAAPPAGVQRTQYQPGQRQMDPVTRTYNDLSVKLREYDAKMQQLGIPRTSRLYQNGLQQIQQAWKPYIDDAREQRQTQRKRGEFLFEHEYTEQHQHPAPQMKEFINKEGESVTLEVKPGFKPPPGYVPADRYKKEEAKPEVYDVKDKDGNVVFRAKGIPGDRQSWRRVGSGKPLSDEEIDMLDTGQIGKTGAKGGLQQNPLSQAQAKFWGEVLRKGGTLPAGLRRSGVVEQVMREMGQTGDPGDFIAKHATVQANAGSLRNMTKMSDAAISFENLANKNFDVALKLAPDAVPTELGPWFNRWVEEGQTALGSPDIPPYVAAMITAANEYAKVMSGSTGTAASTVDSRREARELFSPYLSLPQISQVIAVAKADMANRENTLKEQIGDIQSRLSGGAAPEKAPPVTPGKVYTRDQIIERGGKRYRVIGGDPSDPDVEEVK